MSHFKRPWYADFFVLIASLLLAFAGCGDSEDPAQPAEGGDGGGSGGLDQALTADFETTLAFDTLPTAALDSARQLRIYYGHTSHGSQLMTGLHMLAGESDDFTLPADITEPGGDLGHNGSVTWAATTRAYLGDRADRCDVVIWSWCGGCSDNTPEGIDAYLAAMTALENDYPDITFVYMTGHLDGSGPDGTLYASNNRIRAYCAAHDKLLYDFADIESYDPDGTYYPDESDGCSWCSDWCDSHDCPETTSCAHSHCFNCYQKGKAFWWLLARIAGWEG